MPLMRRFYIKQTLGHVSWTWSLLSLLHALPQYCSDSGNGLNCTKREVGKKVNLSLYSALMRPYLEFCIQL